MRNNKMKGAYYTGNYPNLFEEIGVSKEQADKRLEEIFQTMFYGEEGVKIYYNVGDDMGFVTDTGNNDVRTEGMSYAMMWTVQLNKKEEFDRLWKWVMTYMYMPEGVNDGYFAWSCALDGTKNAWGPAPDGEEFFAMALFFASNRWGDGEGIFEYSKYAKDILHSMIHKGEPGTNGKPMFNPDNHYIKFITEVEFSDPSYHLPHFYEVCADFAYEEDREFLKMAAEESRKYLHKACHEVTGMSAEYAEYDGTPHKPNTDYNNFGGRHDWFYSDAYRTIANIALDYVWFGKDEWQTEVTAKLQKFFYENLSTDEYFVYEIDGTKIDKPALHPVGLFATNAQASLASSFDKKMEYVKKFYNTPLREGVRRYYDNCLYIFAFMALSGNYRIYK